MIRKISLTACLLGAVAGYAQTTTSLAGFSYGDVAAPTGKEWESPQELALNKEQPRAWFFAFSNVDEARKVLPQHSPYWMSLDGTWKFNWVGNPEERPADFISRPMMYLHGMMLQFRCSGMLQVFRKTVP